jgi:hypothetical protein
MNIEIHVAIALFEGIAHSMRFKRKELPAGSPDALRLEHEEAGVQQCIDALKEWPECDAEGTAT